MAQTRPTALNYVRPILRHILLGVVLALSCGCAVLAQADSYLLLQGPRSGSTYRFALGQQLEWTIVGEEDEPFTARILELYPESQAVRLGDFILSLDDIASVRFRRRGQGLRTFLQAQGMFNLALIGIVSVAGGLADGQRNFAISTASISAAMVTAGSVGRRRTRRFGANSRFVLSVAGGDLRKADDPNRG